MRLNQKRKRMKTLEELAGLGSEMKHSTASFEARYWGTWHQNHYWGREREGIETGTPRPFERPDGTTSVDKTAGFHSRPGKKQQLRQANRSQKKRARQVLKRQMIEEATL